MKPGKVHLVGAGPGDPELLTLKAVRVLGQADVVLVDDLVSDAVLAYARNPSHGGPCPRIVYVGKRGGCKSTPQEFIERLMIAEARQGRTVVRLKGGDPFIFGRGGEECEALRAAGIEHEVVNGITAGIAAATALGIPLTHRALCRGAIFVTGHERAGEAADWAALARTGLPLVIYMGVATCGEIQRKLIAGGMPGTTPAAVVSEATGPGQRSLVTRLDRLAAELVASGLGSPAILVIGEVARFARNEVAQDVQQRIHG